ncbi:hypothetical protein JHN59_35060 [Streptomyces sp. MBT49]|uniref:hypothetical protein n=1 Tax=Streptomyces sp. MBT49 TaxID=1488380 RepID=UPI00190D522B|nr:hypothetical protein [Streptomyces sp. MBT49]MBK3629935.1 hypothetical protein [Streptomyces sp. MBT49]
MTTDRPHEPATEGPAPGTAPDPASAQNGPQDPAAPVVPVTPAAPAAPAAPVAPVVPAGPKDRRVLRAVARWTAVVTVFAALGAGTAYGITSMERTDLPGLATASDGRWAYPQITRPPLPSGSPGPFDTGNWAMAHYADLRELVLPAPEGAVDDKALRGTDGWLPMKDFLAVFAAKEDRAEVGRLLVDNGLRHTAARGWTTGDGTRTRVYLLQFDTGTVADRVYGKLTSYGGPLYAAVGATDVRFDDGYPTAADPGDLIRYSYDEVKPYGAEHLRQTYLRAGDVVAVVLQSRKGTAAAVPFQQTVTLQSQLLD